MEFDRKLILFAAVAALGIVALCVAWRRQMGEIKIAAKAEAAGDILAGAAEGAAAPDVALAVASDPTS